MKRISLILFLLTSWLHGEDQVLRFQGPPLVGKILGADASGLRMTVVVVPGQPAATLTLRLAQVREVIFGDGAATFNVLKTATLQQTGLLWQQRERLLPVKGSLAGEIGLTHARLLAASPVLELRQRALPIFDKLLANSPDERIRTKAAEGRLLALVAVGRASEAVEGAKMLAEHSEDPAILIQAKFVLAEASFLDLKKLVADNPKWEEDVNIRPHRNQLYQETLDLYLFPSLFHGAEAEPAARGLWGAIQVCQMGGELAEARELARDIEVFHPTTSYVTLARSFVQALPTDIQKQDYEKQKD